jgi:hypothetical protein
MTEDACLGLEGKGRAARWRLTELGFMNEPPTKRWKGVKFCDQKIQKPGREIPSTLAGKSHPPPAGKSHPPEAESGRDFPAKGEADSGWENGAITKSSHWVGHSDEPPATDVDPDRVQHRPPRGKGRRSTARVVSLALRREPRS